LLKGISFRLASADFAYFSAAAILREMPERRKTVAAYGLRDRGTAKSALAQLFSRRM
jgi:hypothetical protein